MQLEGETANSRLKRVWFYRRIELTSLALIHKQTIAERIANGEYMKDIAADLGCSPAAISQVLAKDADYQAAREAGIEVRLEKYQGDIDTAEDALNLARAREAFRAQSWRAERECPKRWGAKQEMTITQNVSITAALEEAQARVINGSCERLNQAEE